jgi:hypothetical protein
MARGEGWVDGIHLDSKRRGRYSAVPIDVAMLIGVVVDDATFDAHLEVGGTGALMREGVLYCVVERDSPMRDAWRIMWNENTACAVVQDIEIIWRAEDGDGNYPFDV